MALNEKELDFLESHIPELAEVAFKQAFWAALATGSSVLMSEDGNLVEIFPDGTKRVIKALEPRTKVIPGEKIKLKK